MIRLYTAIGTSKQAVHQKLERRLRKLEVFTLVEPLGVEVRKEHPGMSWVRIYHLLNPVGIGRDAFEQHFKQEGYAVGKERNYRQTTNSTGVKRFDNLLAK